MPTQYIPIDGKSVRATTGSTALEQYKQINSYDP